jgi:hypothetical protein
MIEILLIISFLFLIYVFFYKQTTNEYSINQLEFINISKLNNLLYDKIPIIIKGAPVPQCIQPQTILNTKRFTKILSDYLLKKDPTIPRSKDFETYIANETGFQVFGEHYWHSFFHTHIASKYISSIKTNICFGSKPIIKTNAIYTLIAPIEGKYTCSLVNNEFTKYVVPNINSIDQINVSEKQVQYIDIILKPDTILIIPPHWHYIMKEDNQYSYYSVIEYHEPISLLMNYLEKR